MSNLWPTSRMPFTFSLLPVRSNSQPYKSATTWKLHNIVGLCSATRGTEKRERALGANEFDSPPLTAGNPSKSLKCKIGHSGNSTGRIATSFQHFHTTVIPQKIPYASLHNASKVFAMSSSRNFLSVTHRGCMEYDDLLPRTVTNP